MYGNVGGKIKGLAKAIFIVESIATIITGIVLWVKTEEWWCPLIIFLGPIAAWVSSWLLYGFGEIVDRLISIDENIKEAYKVKEINTQSAKEERDCKVQPPIENEIKEHTNQRVAYERKKENVKSDLSKVLHPEDKETAEYIDVLCPECGELLSFNKNNENGECPYCGCAFVIKR